MVTPENKFGSREARIQSFKNIANFFSGIVRGDIVLAPVRRSTYESEVVPLIKAAGDDYSMAEFAVHKALLGDSVAVHDAELHANAPTIKDNPAPQWSRHEIIGRVARYVTAMKAH